ncbi:Cyclic nucleotide-gated cation channel alpha-3 [Fasciolopsis buskii]|uniref:Cyclic nucleotide-gated cation channel alpha-3 n=1 Tax=Fasciolopsis buskii TaxID=27845 RepID=A0A8E0VES9_9TREM|nr:Cyclic nucleotide-gated cation channel alpha-3 [Fasciolopsis buski]
MRMHSVRPELQKRILRWYDYAWYKKRMDGVGDVNALKMLPDKLKSELAVNVNLATLKKVTIFKECRPEFLQDLVLKMRPLIFTPGDFVCRKGEIAREMFIIADGVLEVIGPDDEVISMMSSGDFFGEIGILNRDGANKRTADVRAVGYADLFVLSRSDVLEALQDHPDAEILIKEFARKRLQANRELQLKRALNSANLPYKLLPMISKSRKLQPKTTIDFDQPSEERTSGIRQLTESNRMQGIVSSFTERWNTLMADFVRTYEEELQKLTKCSQSTES